MSHMSSVSYTSTHITRNFLLKRISDSIRKICPCFGCGVSGVRRDNSRTSFFGQDRKGTDKKNFYKASFIPLFLCKFIDNNEIKTMPTTLEMPVIMLICNIPAFIELAQIYNKSELFAYDTLSREINDQFSPIIEFITSQGGDLIQFTNCMMYFIWDTKDNGSLNFQVCNVVDIASYIIECFHHTLRKCNVSIKNVIGISMGDLKIHIVGDTTKVLYCPFGDVVQDCLKAVELSSPGEIVVSEAVWSHLGNNKYCYKPKQMGQGFVQGVIIPFYFGYPGFKHPDDAFRCLMFCREATNVFEALGLSIVFRLALGMCFTGTIGTNHRHETAVFGKVLSNVLHLSHHFTDVKIMCCVNIVLSTRRDIGDIFTFINKRARGFYMPTSYSVDFRSRRPEFKVQCMGRVLQKKRAMNALAHLVKLDNDTRIMLPLISVIGAVGTGRTNFLQWMVQESSTVGYCVRCFIGHSTFDDNFEQAAHIVKEILRLTNCNTQAKIVRLLGTKANDYPLYILNRFLLTEFPETGIFVKNREDLVNSMLVTLVKACTKNSALIIGLDDAEHMGRKSWMFLHNLLVTNTATIIVTFVDPVKPDIPLIINLLKQQYLSISLGPLPHDDLVSLACHFLDVIAIHKYFVSFLLHHSKGNPLRLQEILMLPQLQSHICLSFCKSIVRGTLSEMFHSLKDVPPEKKNKKMNICDILDPEGLPSVYVPQHLLEVVKERTSGLQPEEQMLIKKCACLGDSFSLFLLDVVCPEYSEMHLRCCVKKLLGLNILVCTCKHLITSEIAMRHSTYLEYSTDFCPHPLQFSSKFLRNCITDFIPQGQKYRLHLFIVSLIKDAEIVCEPCRRLAGFQLFASNDIFTSDVTVPKYNLTYCHCLDFKLALYTNIDYHLMRGNAPVSQRIKFFLKASETAVIAQKDPMIQRFLTMAEYLLLKADNIADKTFHPDLAKAGVKRLQAQSHLNAGTPNESVENLTRALVLLGKVFPDSYLRRRRKNLVRDTEFLVEESKCLIIGCALLLGFSKFHDAYTIGKINMHYLKICEVETEGEYPDFVNALEVKVLLLIAGVKASKNKAKRRLHRWMAEIIFLCNAKLNQNPHVGVLGMKAVIKAYTCLTLALFENNSLTSALVVGFRAFQLTKVLNGQVEFLVLAPVLCLVLYHQNNFTKCLEVSIELNDAAQQASDTLIVALSYCMIAKVLKTMGNKEMHHEKFKLCETYSTDNIEILLATQSRSMMYWISSNLALWSFEHVVDELFEDWNARSLVMRDSINKDDYWSIAASLDLANIKVLEIKQRLVSYNPAELEQILEKTEQDIQEIEQNAVTYTPVLYDTVKRIRFRLQDELNDEHNVT